MFKAQVSRMIKIKVVHSSYLTATLKHHLKFLITFGHDFPHFQTISRGYHKLRNYSSLSIRLSVCYFFRLVPALFMELVTTEQDYLPKHKSHKVIKHNFSQFKRQKFTYALESTFPQNFPQNASMKNEKENEKEKETS